MGRLGCAQWSGESLAWLEDLAAAAGGRGTAAGLVARLTDLWQRAVTEDWSWTRLNRHLLTGLLGDRGLLVVAGSDRELHVAATPLYERILAAGPELATLVRDRGRHLETAGYHAQLNDRSLQRPLFRLQDGQRRPLDDGWPTEFTDDLRPGVMLRALIQDWLFEPAAVVVGPGEGGLPEAARRTVCGARRAASPLGTASAGTARADR